MASFGDIDWANVYSSYWRVMHVNPSTWEDTTPLEGIKSVRINRDCTDDASLLEAGTLESVNPIGEDFEEGWYRIEMVVKQGISLSRFPIATLLLESDSGKFNRNHDYKSIDGYSVLQPAKDRKILVGTYAPKGVDGAEYVASLLRECTPAPVITEGSFILEEHVVFGVGVTYIEAAWLILDAANWCMKIQGDGTIVICEKPSTTSLLLNRVNTRLLQPEVSYEKNLSGIPNRYIAIQGNTSATAMNDDPISKTSIQTRGRIIDEIDTDPIRINGETLQGYVERKLEELSTTVKMFSYRREYWPDILPYDIVEGSLNEIGLSGYFRVLSQAITCDHGIVVDERVGMEVKEYEASI